MSKFTYGSFIYIAYDPNNPEHQYRSQNAFTSATKARRLRESFSIILPKDFDLFPFLQSFSILFTKNICRIPKFPRRRNSEDLTARQLILPLVYEFLLFLLRVIMETSWIQCGQTIISVSPLKIIYLASFSIKVSQSRGCSIFFSFNSQHCQQRHHLLIRYQRHHLNDHSQQQQQQQQQSHPRTHSDPWNPSPFSASSRLDNGNAGSEVGRYDYQWQ